LPVPPRYEWIEMILPMRCDRPPVVGDADLAGEFLAAELILKLTGC